MSRQARKKRQLRRTVSLGPRYFLLLERLGQERDEPQSGLVERLLLAEAARLGIEALPDDVARAEMHRRYHEGQRRKARREARDYSLARSMAAEAFEC